MNNLIGNGEIKLKRIKGNERDREKLKKVNDENDNDEFNKLAI